MTNVVCAVCQQQRHTLKMRKSRLKPDMKMLVCNHCSVLKYEPRWLVILVGQDEGLDRVQEYLVNRKYPGDEIPAAALVK